MKTWKDVYELPIQKYEWGTFVFDKKSQFVFQFENIHSIYCDTSKIIDVVNGNGQLQNDNCKIEHKDGHIFFNNVPIILIRGWGNLTGRGAHNLSAEVAANIQDTFAEFIVNRLRS